MVEPQKEKEKEQLFTLSFTRDEILDRIKMLSSSENLNLYMRVQKGALEADELNKLMRLVEPYMK
jgi:hypothetical protein